MKLNNVQEDKVIHYEEVMKSSVSVRFVKFVRNREFEAEAFFFEG